MRLNVSAKCLARCSVFGQVLAVQGLYAPGARSRDAKSTQNLKSERMQPAEIDNHFWQPQCAVGWQEIEPPDTTGAQRAFDVSGLQNASIHEALRVLHFGHICNGRLIVGEVTRLRENNDSYQFEHRIANSLPGNVGGKFKHRTAVDQVPLIDRRVRSSEGVNHSAVPAS